jgi:hypothetical protein
MISGINSNSKYISVQGGSSSSVYISPGSVGAGMVRYNGNTNCIEINDGNVWRTMITSHASVGLTPETEMLLEWAQQKRNEELALKALAEKNEAVRIAVENLNKAQEQLQITAHLAREYDQTTS